MVRLEMEGRPCWCEVEVGEAMAAMDSEEGCSRSRLDVLEQ